MVIGLGYSLAPSPVFPPNVNKLFLYKDIRCLRASISPFFVLFLLHRVCFLFMTPATCLITSTYTTKTMSMIKKNRLLVQDAVFCSAVPFPFFKQRPSCVCIPLFHAKLKWLIAAHYCGSYRVPNLGMSVWKFVKRTRTRSWFAGLRYRLSVNLTNHDSELVQHRGHLGFFLFFRNSNPPYSWYFETAAGRWVIS
jgi:hypothetical protein